jgi:hypothetical protein
MWRREIQDSRSSVKELEFEVSRFRGHDIWAAKVDSCRTLLLELMAARQFILFSEQISVSNLYVGSAANAILLRADLHHTMDQRGWFLMVKGQRMVVHVNDTRYVTEQFVASYHNLEIQDIRGVNKRCILARIAWAIFPLLVGFWKMRTQASEGTLALVDGNTTTLLPNNCKSLYNANPRSRNPSPPKRQRTDDQYQVMDERDGGHDPAYCSWGTYMPEAGNTSEKSAYGFPGTIDAELDESQARGRKRRRSLDDEDLVYALDQRIRLKQRRIPSTPRHSYTSSSPVNDPSQSPPSHRKSPLAAPSESPSSSLRLNSKEGDIDILAIPLTPESVDAAAACS